jgi:2-alkyl-3-oxoalkanoate reductase
VPHETRFDGVTAAVTGAGGFIGRAVAAGLGAGGARVRGIDIGPEAAEGIRAVGAEPVVADVTDPAALTAALDGAELVIHTAAHVRDWGTMADFVRVNVAGTATALGAAQAAGAGRFVQISSVVVYGYDDPSEQGEESFRRAVGIPYIDTKSASDRLAARRGAVVVRPGDVYGPRSISWVVRPLELARRNSLVVPSPGDGVMLPIYVDDLVEAILMAADRGEPGLSYTAWDGHPVTFRDYFARIAEIAGAAPPRTLPKPLLEVAGTGAELLARLRGGPPAFSSRAPTFVDRRGTASAERIRALGWEPGIGLEEGLRRSADWARAEGLA